MITINNCQLFQALSGSDAGLIPDDSSPSPPKRATQASQKLKRLSKMLKDKIPTKMKDTATSIAHNSKIGKKASPKASKKNSKDEKQVLSLHQSFLFTFYVTKTFEGTRLRQN